MVRIAVVGTGYVGLSNAVLLAQHNQVVALDIVPEKVDLLNDRLSPIEDAQISDYLANRPLNLRATLDREWALGDAQFSSSPRLLTTTRIPTASIPARWSR